MTKKMTKKEFTQLAKEGPIKIDEHSNYVIVKVNDDNLDLLPKLRSQLVKENKYDNTYIGFITHEKNKPYGTINLPVYGRSDKYETKHFNKDFEKAVSADIREFKLLERVKINN
ncbi:MAG TPA: hypothetical protein GXZ90_04525 [Clostridiales bacterium]|nr:hypothetical protein [Clostridiales bacterium]